MGNALAGEFIKLPMQRYRIGRCQRSVEGPLRRDKSDGADARRWMTEPLPYLPRESGDRSLSAGARNGRNGCGLPWIEPGRCTRQCATRIGYADERHRRGAFGSMFAHYGNRAGRNGLIDETTAIGLAACEGEEHFARPDCTAIDGETRHLGCFCPRVDCGLIAEQFAKSHDLPVRPR